MATGIKVRNARELRRALRNADPELKKQLRTAYRSSASIVSVRARRDAPVLSYDLRDSIRPLGGVSKAVVAIGKGRSKDYAGRNIFGDPDPGIEANDFPFEALRLEWPKVYAHFEQAVDKVADTIDTTGRR